MPNNGLTSLLVHFYSLRSKMGYTHSFSSTNCDYLSALTTIPHSSFLTFSSSFHSLLADVYLSVPQAGQVDPGTALNSQPSNFTQFYTS